MKLIDAIIEIQKKVEKNICYSVLKLKGKGSSNFSYKFEKHENHPIQLYRTEMYNQNLHYCITELDKIFHLFTS